MLRRALKLLLWRTLAAVCVALGLLGVVLPGLPTVPFLLLAAWAGGHGWPALEVWLLQHPRYGPGLRQWRERGAVPRQVVCASFQVAPWSVERQSWVLPSATTRPEPLEATEKRSWQFGNCWNVQVLPSRERPMVPFVPVTMCAAPVWT